MSYSYFAKYYDVLTENVDYHERALYLSELCRYHEHECGVTLDLACGTGSLTIELKKLGIDVFGADMSSDMLSEAQMKAYENDMIILFLCQRMQELELYGQIDTCFCTLDSINHITSKKELIKCFRAVSKYLSDDGLFVFDVNTIFKHKEILGDNCYIYDTEEVFCAWQNNYQARNNKVIITLDFFEPDENGSYIRTSEQFSERAYSHDEMNEMLSLAGLETKCIYKDLSFDPPTDNTQREIFLIRKKKNGK